MGVITTETSPRRWETSVDRNVGCCNFMEFVVYMIHACANAWQMTPRQVYQKLQVTGCINEYIVPNYEILHNKGSRYLVDDVKDYLRIRGVIV